jgi:hypothetical protein
MGSMHVADRARGGGNGYAFDLLDISRFEIRVVKN